MQIKTANYLPISLAFLTFLAISISFYGIIHILNIFISQKILFLIRISDIAIGVTIYLKTSIDFAIFIAQQMRNHPGIQNRIAIEIGTAFGNFIGTTGILIIWSLFKVVPLLLIIMIFIASLVLFHLAHESITTFPDAKKNNLYVGLLTTFLGTITFPFKPLYTLLPQAPGNITYKKTFSSLLLYSLLLPLILGLDDFAGYIPLFTVVNIFGFAIGVFFGHLILNLFLFASPNQTIRIIKQPFITIFGTMAFLIIGMWGIIEGGLMLWHLLFP